MPLPCTGVSIDKRLLTSETAANTSKLSEQLQLQDEDEV